MNFLVIRKLLGLQVTLQEKLDSLPWNEAPTPEMRKALILQELNPRRRGFEVQRVDAYYLNLVESYKISSIFAKSDPVNGTQVGTNVYMKPHSEKHRAETEDGLEKLRTKILSELGLDLNRLVSQSRQ